MSELDPKTRKSWQMIEKLVLQNSRNQRNQQRWSIFFRLVFFVYIGVIIWMLWPVSTGSVSLAQGPHVAQVSVNGVIAAGKPASAKRIIHGLESAFASDSKLIMLKINSPGGSPVQAGEVYREINYLKGEYPDKKVVAVITDVGASGAYYIAAAADQIYADQASIVGSIGVIMRGFGLQGAIEKLGIKRRVMAAGSNKDMLDPFQPVTKQQKKYVQTMLDDIHQQFIHAVKKGRGDRLKVKGHPDIFSGLFWTGDQALKLGLIDGLGSPREVARKLTGDSNIVDYTVYPSRLKRLLKRLGASISHSALNMLGMTSNVPSIR